VIYIVPTAKVSVGR